MVKDQQEVMHMVTVQAKGIQLNFDTSWMSVYKSDKPELKATDARSLTMCGRNL